jgi:hypothetical protein
MENMLSLILPVTDLFVSCKRKRCRGRVRSASSPEEPKAVALSALPTSSKGQTLRDAPVRMFLYHQTITDFRLSLRFIVGNDSALGYVASVSEISALSTFRSEVNRVDKCSYILIQFLDNIPCPGWEPHPHSLIMLLLGLCTI